MYKNSDSRFARNMEGGRSVNRLMRRKIDGGKPVPSRCNLECIPSDFGGKMPNALDTMDSFSWTALGFIFKGVGDPEEGRMRATAKDEVITLAIDAFRQ